MGKLIIGIVVVALSQIAFITYMMTDPPVDLSANVPVVSIGEPGVLAEQISRPNTITIRAETVFPELIAANRPRPQSKRIKNVVTAGQKPRTRSSNQTLAAQFRESPAVRTPRPRERSIPRVQIPDQERTASKIIYYDPKPAVVHMRIVEAPKTKKRSLVAKAMPILKKPWNLMKSIASKLN